MTDTENRPHHIERELTLLEIEQRTKLHLELATERDKNLSEIADKRSAIRALNVSRKKLDLESAQIRREIHSGKVLEPSPPQASPQLAFELAFEPEPSKRHGEGPLLDPIALRHLVTTVRPRELWPTVKDVEGWHEQVRADVQRWCRAEIARAHPTAGTPVPAQIALPNVLDNIAHDLEQRAASKAKSAGKPKKARVVRPYSGTRISQPPARGRSAKPKARK